MNRARRGRLASSIVTSSILVGLLVGASGPAFAGDTGGALRSPVGSWRTSTAGIVQTVTFAKDGTVYGDSGCNRFTGGYTVKGDRITIGPLASTLMACPQPQMDAEASFLNKLQSAVSYTATKKVLKLFTPKDMMRFAKN